MNKKAMEEARIAKIDSTSQYDEWSDAVEAFFQKYGESPRGNSKKDNSLNQNTEAVEERHRLNRS